MSPRETDLDPRYPSAFQRGGATEAPLTGPGAGPPRSASPSGPVLDDGVAVPASTQRHRAAARVLDDRAHFEIVVAGNPWLRALWTVGALALALAIAAIVYSEFAFSAPAGGIYDPSAFVVPRIAQVLATPLSIAGVVALTAAASLRIVAWRPSGARAADD